MAHRPFTGQRGMPMTPSRRPPATSRMKTAQMPGTSAGQQAAFLPSKEIKVSDRPVTGAGGLAGMKPPETASMPGRQVHDASYFVGVLRSKHADISKEIVRLNSEVDRIKKESSQYNQLENVFEELLRDVRRLEGTLADYNLAMDKARTGVAPEEIFQYQEQLLKKNKDLEGEIDNIFLSKQRIERDSLRMEEHISNLYQSVEEMFKTQADSEKLRAYRDLMKRTRDLHMQGQKRENEIDALRGKIHEVEGSMRGNGFREEYNRAGEKVSELKKKLSKLNEDLELADMDPKEAHTVLLNKVKENQRNVGELDKKSSEIDDEMQRFRRVQKELQTELDVQESADDQDYMKKYEMAFQKDKEMTAFLETIDGSISEILSEQNCTKSSIVALLEHISSGIAASEEELPSQERLEDIKGEVSFKTKHLETSQQTVAMLQRQKVQRTEELEKIDNLEEKIATELQQLEGKTQIMKEDIERFKDIAFLHERADSTKGYLHKMTELYIEQTESIKEKTTVVSSKLEGNRKTLDKSETAKNIEALEQKLRQQGQNIFSLTEFIATRGRQTDFQSLRENCGQLVEKLNKMSVEAA